MTPQEQGMIDDLVQRIRTTPVTDKDMDAERHLQQGLGSVPDALYILAQTVLVQEYGLTQAQAQLQARQDEIDQLRSEQQASAAHPEKKSGSFLSKIFGSDEASGPNAAQAPPPPNAGSGYQPVNYAPAPQAGYAPPYGGQPYPGQGYAPAGYASQGYGGPGLGSNPGAFGGGGGGGFLRGALQTAAGVAAGAMVFEGAESLFRGFGGGGHEGREFGGAPGETVVNNYYGDEGDRGDRGGDRGDREDRDDRSLAGNDDGSFYNPAHDASRQDAGGDSRGFADTGGGSDFDTTDNDDTGGADDSSDFSDSDDSGGSDGGDDSNY